MTLVDIFVGSSLGGRGATALTSSGRVSTVVGWLLSIAAGAHPADGVEITIRVRT